MTKKRYIFKTDLSASTCKLCKSYEGKVFYEDDLPKIPLHQNCNCVLKLLYTPAKKDSPNAPSENIIEPYVPDSLSYLKKLSDVLYVMEESENIEHVSFKAIELLSKYEKPWQPEYLIYDADRNVIGIRPHEIGDGGVTVGFGHYISYDEILNSLEAQNLASRNLSIEEAFELMGQDLIRFENHLFKIMRENEIYLRQHEFDALVLMSYNLGNVNFLVDFLTTGNRTISDWQDIITKRMVANKGTKFYNGLMNRRYQEINLFLYRDYEGGPDVKTYP